MDIGVARGRTCLQVVFVLLAGMYVSERLIDHAAVGFGGLATTTAIGALLVGLCVLIERGVAWLR